MPNPKQDLSKQLKDKICKKKYLDVESKRRKVMISIFDCVLLTYLGICDLTKTNSDELTLYSLNNLVVTILIFDFVSLQL